MLQLALALCTLNASAQADFLVSGLSPLDYQVPGVRKFNVSIKNNGTMGISSFMIYWQQDGGAIKSVSKNASNVKWGGTVGLVQDPAFTMNFPTAGTYKLKVWIKLLQPTDNNAANDTMVKTVQVFDALPKKNVVLEVLKHQACGPCYPAAVYNDTLVAKNPTYSIVHIYTVKTDALYNQDGADFDDVYNYGHPAPIFDRYKFDFLPELGSNYVHSSTYKLENYGDRDEYFEPVEVYFKTASFDEATRQLKVKVGATFYDKLNGDYRFNLYLTEDSLKAYQGDAPDPNNYYHKYVLRAMVGGIWGQQGSLPSSINKGDAKDYEFTYTVPKDYNINKMTITAMVQNYTGDVMNRRILNSVHKSFRKVLSVEDMPVVANDVFQAYPNPAGDVVHISFTDKVKNYKVWLADMTGKVCYSAQHTGEAEINLKSLPAGTYLLFADDGDRVSTKRLVKQ